LTNERLNRVNQHGNGVRKWAQDYSSRTHEEGGGNYYLTRAAYLTHTYMRLAFANCYRRAISLEELAGYSSVRATSVAGLEQAFAERIR
jgi:hypothetical protein